VPWAYHDLMRQTSIPLAVLLVVLSVSSSARAESYNWHRPAGWAALGMAAVAGGTGYYFLGKAQDQRRLFNEAPHCGALLPDRGGSDCASFEHKANRARTIGTTGLVLSGALLASSIYFFVTDRDPDVDGVAFTVGDRQLGLQLSGRF
jgi:hypothetical protein